MVTWKKNTLVDFYFAPLLYAILKKASCLENELQDVSI
jgi:hypothetical protein